MLGLLHLLCLLCFCRSLLLKELLTVTGRFVVEVPFCMGMLGLPLFPE